MVTVPQEITDPKARRKYLECEWQKIRRAKDPEGFKARRRVSYLKNREREIQLAKDYAKSDPERRRKARLKHRAKENAAANLWNRTHRTHIRERRRKQYQENPEIRLAASHARRARKAGSEFELKRTQEFIASVRQNKSIPCYYCGVVMNGKNAHIDHVIAISRSGNHSVDNLCASCPACNYSKHARRISDWKKPGQQILDL